MTRDQYKKASLLMEEIRRIEKLLKETEEGSMVVKVGETLMPSKYITDDVLESVRSELEGHLLDCEKVLAAL
jgi:hypothetical protein